MVPVLEIDLKDNCLAQSLFGEHNSNLRLIEKIFPVEMNVSGTRLIVEGAEEDLNQIHNLFQTLQNLYTKGYKFTSIDVEKAASILRDSPGTPLLSIFEDKICLSPKKKIITPKSLNQKLYIDAIRKFDIVFGIGPAGTGKTYLAMAMAVAALQRQEVRRIILTRPAVEAGEKLGFLPGDLIEKVNPYLRPLYDALNDMLEFEKVKDLLAENIIEVAPLAFMRGRTLNDSFVILDEAQNSTSEQMKMFLTRLGMNSKAVITGDVTQIDLPQGTKSGLVEGEKLLNKIEGIKFVHFSGKDVVRHRLVQDIINAYSAVEKKKKR